VQSDARMVRIKKAVKTGNLCAALPPHAAAVFICDTT
jgi:hypothetical protein